MPSKRPARYITPEEWKANEYEREREISAKAADDVAREEVEEEDKAARRKSKKKKKDEKKEKKKSKKDKKKKDEVDDDEYEGSGVRGTGGHVRKPWLDRKLKLDHPRTRTRPLQQLSCLRTKSRLMVKVLSPLKSIAYPEEWLEWEEFVSQQEGPNSGDIGQAETCI